MYDDSRLRFLNGEIREEEKDEDSSHEDRFDKTTETGNFPIMNFCSCDTLWALVN